MLLILMPTIACFIVDIRPRDATETGLRSKFISVTSRHVMYGICGRGGGVQVGRRAMATLTLHPKAMHQLWIFYSEHDLMDDDVIGR